MYIYDALYGKVEFPSFVWRCILTPEVQRLREVRLCNINSLCITGSANTNRFEHSVGTAFLAEYNVLHNKDKYVNHCHELDELVLASLLHDVANGPFGHSYEYLREKEGFVPEKGLKNIFSSVVEFGQGATGYSTPYEKVFFGQLRSLTGILSESQKQTISDIIGGNHYFSKLLVNNIDFDNIDNVFRMAYHMGIPFPIEAPIELAKSMYLVGEQVVYRKSAEKYLHCWYETRKKVYKFLLLNPQEFAGKYMLSEAMDISFQDKFQNNTQFGVKWYYTDFQLLEMLSNDDQKEKWIDGYQLLKNPIDIDQVECIRNLPKTDQTTALKSFVESIELTTPIKNRGKSGNSRNIELSDSFTYETKEENGESEVLIHDRGMHFVIQGEKLFKKVRVKYNPSQIISRLVCGDLYDCLMIVKSKDLSKYSWFLDYERRIGIENELESIIRSNKDFRSLNIGIHPILDKNKTERKLEVLYEGEDSPSTIGVSSNDLLLGVFLKNEPYGLKHAKTPLAKHREELKLQVLNFFSKLLDGAIDVVNLYEEVDEYGCKRY